MHFNVSHERRGRVTRRRIAAAVVMVVGFGSLVACSGQATGSTPATGSTAVVKIGAPYPLTGSWAENGQNSLNGMQLAAEMINKDGGIKALGGAQVQIVSKDTSSDKPAQATSVTTDLITQDKVSALVGSFASALSMTSTTAAEKYQVPIITQSTVDALTTRGYKYTFQLPPLGSVSGQYQFTYTRDLMAAAGKPMKTIGLASTNDAVSVANEDALEKIAEQNGVQVVVKKSFAADLSDPTPVTTALRDANPDVIMSGAPLAPAVQIVKSLRSMGVNTPIVEGVISAGFAKALGDQANGIIASIYWSDSMKLPGDQAQLLQVERDAYNAEFGTTFEPQEAGESFEAVYQIVAAIEAAKSSDPKAIADQLHTLKFDTGYAATQPPGVVQYNQDGLNTNAVPIVVQFQKGIPVAVWPEDLASAPPIALN
jgi:branched-chain amino acid transport system substrate-binding protein